MHASPDIVHAVPRISDVFTTTTTTTGSSKQANKKMLGKGWKTDQKVDSIQRDG